MVKKGIYACIWLLGGEAVRGFGSKTPMAEDPAQLAKKYAQAGVDGVVLFDLSDGDAAHEEAIAMIRRICEETLLTVIGAGNIRRMEDVKKLIYAGCDLAALNLSREANRRIAREVCERFGRERIAGCCRASELSDRKLEGAFPWISMQILLDAPDPETTVQTQLPVIAFFQDASADTLAAQLVREDMDVRGVCGGAVNALAADGEAGIGFLRDAIARARKNAGKEDGEGREKEGKENGSTPAAFSWEDFKKGPDGLLPVVVQEDATNQVLMVAYMNEEAYNLTVSTGKMTYYSRSRRSLWVKGETSGHFQHVRALYGDCDMDTLLARVVQIGAACHTGSHSCFFNKVQEVQQDGPYRMRARGASAVDVLREDYRTIVDRRDNPKEGSYTNYLFEKGIDKMLKKLGEENTEIIIAAKNPGENEIIYEIADYLYHLEVVMAEKGVDWEDISRELVRRQKDG